LPAAVLEVQALRNSSLQGAYFMLAARAFGLDCGPMSGFDNAKVDALFFTGTTVKSNFLCNLGHGDATKLFPRSPRRGFEETCRIECPRFARSSNSSNPFCPTRRTAMFPVKTLLHPTDLTDASRHAFDVACQIAKDRGARIVILHVVPPSNQ